MSLIRFLGIFGVSLLGICGFAPAGGGPVVSTSIGPDLSLSSNVSSEGSPAPLEPAGGDSSGSSNSSRTEGGEGAQENASGAGANPEIIPVNANYTRDACFNRTLPIFCNNSNSTLITPAISGFTTTISGEAGQGGIKYEFKSDKDEDLISFRLNGNDKKAYVRMRSVVNGTQVSDKPMTLEIGGNQNDFAVNKGNSTGSSSVSMGVVTFVMVITNTTVSFTVNSLVYGILNVNLGEQPMRISKILTSGLEETRISVVPFIENDETGRCTLSVPISDRSAENLVLSPYSRTCLSRDVTLSPNSLVSGSQLVLGIPGSVSTKSAKLSSQVQVSLSSKSGELIFNLFINDKGIFLKKGTGTDIIQSRGGYFPIYNFGIQSCAIKLILNSLFVVISVNGFYPFDEITIPEGEYPSELSVKGTHRSPTVTMLPTRPCSKYSISEGTACSLDGVLPLLKSSGVSGSSTHGYTTVAIRATSEVSGEKSTHVSFKNGVESSDFTVGLDGSRAVVTSNSTSLGRVAFENLPHNDTFLLKVENVGGLKRSYFDNLENARDTQVSSVLKDYSVSVSGDGVSKISSEFIPVRTSCVLEQHRGSYVSTLCEGDRLCFATSSSGSPIGGVLHFIGGFSSGLLKVNIFTRSEDLSFGIEYTSSGDISVYRTSAIKEKEPIYKGYYLDESTAGTGRAAIGIKDLGQYFLLSIDKMEVTRVSKGGLGSQGNISCVQMVANESDNMAIFFEIK
ncbi:signal peptide containing protein [Cryptosporidium felis]|nr:signal peptide containing protein [Cryptosporidium felis]